MPKRQIAIILTLFIAALLLGCPQPSRAALTPAGEVSGGPVSPWFPISTLSTSEDEGDDEWPSVAYNSLRNEYLVVWVHFDSNHSSNTLYGRFIKGNGAPKGESFTIQGCSRNSTNVPDVIYNPNRNEYLVVSHLHLPVAGICAVRLTANGLVIDDPELIASGGEYYYVWATAAYEPANAQYLVTWQKQAPPAFSVIEAVSLKGDGTASSPITQVTSPSAETYPGNPEVACVRTALGCLVVWAQKNIYTDSDYDVLGQRIQMQGGAHRQGAPITIASSTDDEVNPNLASIVISRWRGQYLVAYTQQHDDEWSVFTRTITDDGSLEQSSWLGPADGRLPAVGGSQSGQSYLVVWSSVTSTSIPAVTVSTAGMVGKVSMASNGGVFPYTPKVAAGNGGSFLVVEEAHYPGYFTSDILGFIWAQRLYLPVVNR